MLSGRDSAFIRYGFSPEDVAERSFVYDHAPLACRVFWVRWRQFLSDLDEGLVLGKILYRASGLEFQREGLIHGHINVRADRFFMSRKHLESEISADTSR